MIHLAALLFKHSSAIHTTMETLCKHGNTGFCKPCAIAKWRKAHPTYNRDKMREYRSGMEKQPRQTKEPTPRTPCPRPVKCTCGECSTCTMREYQRKRRASNPEKHKAELLRDKQRRINKALGVL